MNSLYIVLFTPSVPDTAVTPSDNFSVFRMDRTAEGRVNPKVEECVSWLTRNGVTPGISPLCRAPVRLIWKHLSIICRPFYLPREFSSVIATAVYIPPQADTGLALSKLHDVLSGYINKHPDAAFIIAGDFNKPTSGRSCQNFHQHVSCQLHLHLHLHLVIWQTLLSKATYNWGIHKAISSWRGNQTEEVLVTPSLSHVQISTS